MHGLSAGSSSLPAVYQCSWTRSFRLVIVHNFRHRMLRPLPIGNIKGIDRSAECYAGLLARLVTVPGDFLEAAQFLQCLHRIQLCEFADCNTGKCCEPAASSALKQRLCFLVGKGSDQLSRSITPYVKRQPKGLVRPPEALMKKDQLAITLISTPPRRTYKPISSSLAQASLDCAPR